MREGGGGDRKLMSAGKEAGESCGPSHGEGTCQLSQFLVPYS